MEYFSRRVSHCSTKGCRFPCKDGFKNLDYKKNAVKPNRASASMAFAEWKMERERARTRDIKVGKRIQAFQSISVCLVSFCVSGT